MRKEGASGSSETSVSGTRGVLRRMARVTSDDAHINTLILNRNSSPTHKVASPVSEDQGVLGAGLPLLQRLKLLKEKEEREERLRQQEAESEGRSQHSASNEKLKENGEQEPPAEEEPEVVGAGLPLFARLRLLKAKEEKERLEREEKQRKLSSDGSQGSVTKDDDTKGELAAVARESVVQGKESKPSSNRASKSNSTERTSSQESKARDSDSSSGTSDSRSKSTLGVATSANSVQPGQALDRAFGKLLSKKMKASTAAATAVTAGAAAAAAASRTNNIASESSNDKDKALSETKSTDKVNSDSDNKSKEKSACQKPLHTLQVKDKVMRSESFKKAIDEGLIRSTEIKSPTKETFKELRKTDKESQEKGKSSPVDRPVGSSSSSLCTPSSKPRSPPVSQEAPKDSGKAEDKKVSEEEGRAGTFKGEAIPTIALSSTPPPERKEQEASKKKTVQKVDSLKVPDEDVSPPLSSPESNETPERKSLKSILKRMSREDSGSNLLPPKGADLKKLMKAPTVEGFVARRSKFSKSVSFQRQTLSSPPLPSNLADTGSRNARGGVSKGKDGIDKVLTKLGALGLDASPSPPNDTQGLVRKIIHGKLATSSLEDEVELLWAARVEELQQQLARRDETIRQLTHTLLRIQSESQPDTKENDQELEDEVETDESSRERTNHGDSSSSDVVSSDGETADGDEDEDEDEPLFMRCDSIESIIHHTPRMSPDEDDDDLGQLDECPSTNYEGSFEVSDEEQERPRLSRMSRSLDAGTAGGQLWRLEFPTNWTRTSSLTSRPSGEVALDIGSSTDEDIHSLSSDDDHAVPGIPSDYVNEDFVSAEVLGDVEEGACPTQTFSSQDWEVQMLAEELAKKQRGVARQVDRDIEAGRVHSGLVDLHEALISSNLNDLSDNDVLRLEKVIHTERERLRHYARMYSLDEQPVLEQEFTALYRSRSQLLISRSSELFKAGPKQRKLSKLLDQLATLSPAEKFLLDRILYTTARKQQLVRHKSMCDDQLTSHSDQRLLDAKRRTLMSRRSISMCSPSVDNSPILPRSSLSTSESQEDPKAKKEGKAKSLLERRGPPTVSAMLASLQRSVSVMSGNGSRESGKTSPQRNAPRKQEAEPLLRPPQEQ